MTTNIPPINITIAQRLKEVAELLHSQGSNPFRVQAYHHAARTLEQLEQPVDGLLRTKAVEELKTLPGIGALTSSGAEDKLPCSQMRQTIKGLKQKSLLPDGLRLCRCSNR